MTNRVTTVTSKTKSGKSIQVAVIPVEMTPGLEIQYKASEIALAHGCTHYRVVKADGSIYAGGKANSDASYGSFGPQG